MFLIHSLIHFLTECDCIPFCCALCYVARSDGWLPGLQETKSAREMDPTIRIVRTVSWESLGCLLRMPVPGPSPDLLSENCWKQGPEMCMCSTIPR